ncbi:Rha family transcriptional regulator [Selenomonas ruminantium]|uniref:Rha family transcriptional regulator n=1 Tax=Selenomonas ruminantium TaxID=971 RepID=UPI0026F1A590|nr:Rha family transcriptional regulator [Selenomonas ruminantium]
MKVMTVANSNLDELVQVNDEQVVTDSRRVAEVFEKEHRNVTATIREILAAENSAARFFHEITYENRGKQYPCYLMNRDGFSLLVMGFTGKKALEWKIKYIEAFNAMEKQLKTPKLSPNPHYRTRMIKTAVKDISETADVIAQYFGVKPGMARSAAMTMVGSAYGIDPEPLRQLLPSEEKPSYLTPTAIGEMLGGIRAKDVNIMLMDLGLQEKSGKGWMLTTKGKEFGESIPYTRNGHSGYQIQWCPEVVEHLR